MNDRVDLDNINRKLLGGANEPLSELQGLTFGDLSKSHDHVDPAELTKTSAIIASSFGVPADVSRKFLKLTNEGSHSFKFSYAVRNAFVPEAAKRDKLLQELEDAIADMKEWFQKINEITTSVPEIKAAIEQRLDSDQIDRLLLAGGAATRTIDYHDGETDTEVQGHGMLVTALNTSGRAVMPGGLKALRVNRAEKLAEALGTLTTTKGADKLFLRHLVKELIRYDYETIEQYSSLSLEVQKEMVSKHATSRIERKSWQASTRKEDVVTAAPRHLIRSEACDFLLDRHLPFVPLYVELSKLRAGIKILDLIPYEKLNRRQSDTYRQKLSAVVGLEDPDSITEKKLNEIERIMVVTAPDDRLFILSQLEIDHRITSTYSRIHHVKADDFLDFWLSLGNEQVQVGKAHRTYSSYLENLASKKGFKEAVSLVIEKPLEVACLGPGALEMLQENSQAAEMMKAVIKAQENGEPRKAKLLLAYIAAGVYPGQFKRIKGIVLGMPESEVPETAIKLSELERVNTVGDRKPKQRDKKIDNSHSRRERLFSTLLSRKIIDTDTVNRLQAAAEAEILPANFFNKLRNLSLSNPDVINPICQLVISFPDNEILNLIFSDSELFTRFTDQMEESPNSLHARFTEVSAGTITNPYNAAYQLLNTDDDTSDELVEQMIDTLPYIDALKSNRSGAVYKRVFIVGGVFSAPKQEKVRALFPDIEFVFQKTIGFQILKL